jgi:uncharacterized membrane-anchored protein
MIGVTDMVQFLLIAIGIAFVCYFTYRFIKRLRGREQGFWKSLWQWIKDVFDAITGMG